MFDSDSFNLGQWRGSRGDPALAEVNRSIAVQGGGLRRFAAFLGPGYLVAVGYMDPGNWATSLAGGVEIRLYALGRGLGVEPDGHCAAILDRAAGHRLGP